MRKKYSILAAAVLILALVLTACSWGDQTGETKGSTAAETKAPAAGDETGGEGQGAKDTAASGDGDSQNTNGTSGDSQDAKENGTADASGAGSGQSEGSKDAAAAGSGESGDTAETQASVGIMGSFNATDIDGNAVDQSVFADYKLTMVNVWTTFCGPCLREMPDLGELAAEYKDKGVRIVGLVSDTLDNKGEIDQSQVDYAKEIVSDTGANYLHILPSTDLFGLLSQISSVPTTFFVDSEGHQVGSAYMGSREKDDWIKIIDSTLEEVQ